MREELDTILAQAIESYSAVEPSPDLAGRILRQAQMQAPSSRRGWKPVLAFGLPLAAALALAFVLLGQWGLPKPPAAVASVPSTPGFASQVHPQPAKTMAVATREVLPAHRRARNPASRRSWARPLPAPYSKEELALLNFVQQHPKEAAEIAEAQRNEGTLTPPQPLKIAPLKTEPITIAALN